MKKLWLIGGVLALACAASEGQAQWGDPPPGYRPPLVVQPDGTPAPCADGYGLCAAWKRKHGWKTECPYGLGGPCRYASFWDRVRARSGLLCIYP